MLVIMEYKANESQSRSKANEIPDDSNISEFSDDDKANEISDDNKGMCNSNYYKYRKCRIQCFLNWL